MLKTRNDLYQKAKQTYKALLDRTAERYYGDYQYVISDKVSYECTFIEDVLRPMWGIAPFLKDNSLFVDVKGKRISAVDFINTVMIDGTSASSSRRFDRNVTAETEYVFSNQTTTETAAYLVAVRFAKEALWDPLDKNTRDSIAGWLKKWAVCAIKNSWQNNHYWYPIYCLEILKWLGYDSPECEQDIRKGYDFLESLYYGNGWYSDGELGRFDYYEAWAHHTYTLLWLLIADENSYGYKDRFESYKRRSEEYLKYFIHYFDSDGGMVAYGRSIGYRFAAVAPFGLGVLLGLDIDPGVAKNVILKNIEYFYKNSVPTADGCFPVGYLYESSGFGEGYASDGAISCYTEGFLCLLAGDDHPLWTAEIKALPIENGNYFKPCPLKELQTAVYGNNLKNGVTLYNNGLHYYQDRFFSHRFNDMAGSYSKFVYNSRAGYSLSSVDCVSSDNMISLYTPDGTMASHRRKILAPEFDGRTYSSTHIPFSNDAETTVKTWLIPLKNGYHLRIHKLNLSREYIVFEGGFTLGVRNDGYKEYGNRAEYGKNVSEITVYTELKTEYVIERSHPGMHLLAPQSIYPAYRTDALKKGEYLIATLVYFATDGIIEEKPVVEISGKRITVIDGDETITVNTEE